MSKGKPGKKSGDSAGDQQRHPDGPSKTDRPGKADKGAHDKRSGKGSRSKRVSQPDSGQWSSSLAASSQRLYDMPYSASAPRVINPEIGLHNLVTRAGHNAGYTIDVTLLDAPDHRLLRSGVLLAHRVLDGRGEWYLGAAEWQPMLPAERVQPMSNPDLPEEFAELTRPFRRRATLGPIAALTCERREFALRDDRGTTLALLRDDKVTVRRGGLTTARYREVMVTPMGEALNDEQAMHVARTLTNAGATQVPRFPRLVSRLGAPATGPTDFPVPQSLEQDAPFAQFVSHLLATRLRQILTADLAIRTHAPGGHAQLAAHVAQLRTDLRGLSSVLDDSWLADLDEELDWVAGQTALEKSPRAGIADGNHAPDLAVRLRGERYLSLLDRLVNATRAPQLGNASTLQAAEVLGSLVNVALGTLVKAASKLTVDSSGEDWQAITLAFDDLFRVTAVAQHQLPQRVARLRHRLGVAAQLLGEAAKHAEEAQHSKDLAASSPADDAFALGRAYEHELAVARLAREAFVRRWAKTAKKLS